MVIDIDKIAEIGKNLLAIFWRVDDELELILRFAHESLDHIGSVTSLVMTLFPIAGPILGWGTVGELGADGHQIACHMLVHCSGCLDRDVTAHRSQFLAEVG